MITHSAINDLPNHAMKAFLLLCLFVRLPAYAAAPKPEVRDREVRNLERIFPLLEDLKVTRFGPKQVGAGRPFYYARGKFSQRALPLDDMAIADAARLTKELDATEAEPVGIREARYSPRGKLTYAEFELFSYFQRFYYVYSPSCTQVPNDKPNEQTHTRINDDWYFMWIDWN